MRLRHSVPPSIDSQLPRVYQSFLATDCVKVMKAYDQPPLITEQTPVLLLSTLISFRH